jgi:hypothetical protein
MKDTNQSSLQELMLKEQERLQKKEALIASWYEANNSPPRTVNSSTGTGGKMNPSDIHARLCAPFDKSEEKERKGPGGKMLTYIDARAVMNRLDEVVGPGGWSTKMVEVKGVVVCELSLNIGPDGMWITKCDGAGETDIEGEKGQFSDAFKRAAVHFGIGRYLYEGKGAKRPTSVANAVLAGVDRAPEPVIDEAEMQMRKMLNKLGDDVINLENAQLERDEILFSFSAEEKIQLWQRFDAAERKAIKQLKLDW